MPKISPLNYAFAVGKIRALEKFLIKAEAFEEAAGSNLEEALKIFVESDLYNDDLLEVKDSERLEEILNKELSALKKLVSGLLIDKKLAFLLHINKIDNIKKIPKNSGNEFLDDYLKHLIDMLNIKTYLRLYILKEPIETLKNKLEPGGFINSRDFIEVYNKDLSFFLNRLRYVHKRNLVMDYASFFKNAVEKIQNESSFIALERSINSFLIEVLKPAKYLTFGPLPVAAYYFAKVNEINLIRMIILSKLNNLETDFIKEGLNSVYA